MPGVQAPRTARWERGRPELVVRVLGGDDDAGRVIGRGGLDEAGHRVEPSPGEPELDILLRPTVVPRGSDAVREGRVPAVLVLASLEQELRAVELAVRRVDPEELATAPCCYDVPAEAALAALAAVDQLQDPPAARALVHGPCEQTPDAGPFTWLARLDLRARRFEHAHIPRIVRMK